MKWFPVLPLHSWLRKSQFMPGSSMLHPCILNQAISPELHIAPPSEPPPFLPRTLASTLFTSIVASIESLLWPEHKEINHTEALPYTFKKLPNVLGRNAELHAPLSGPWKCGLLISKTDVFIDKNLCAHFSFCSEDLTSRSSEDNTLPLPYLQQPSVPALSHHFILHFAL